MNHNHQKGVALITTLMIVSLAIGVSTYLIWLINNRIEIHELQGKRLQSKLIAQTGIEWAGAILLDDLRRSGNIDTPNEVWAQPLPTLPVRINPENPNSAVFVSGNISDENGKLNINNFAFNNNPEIKNYHYECLKRLLVILDIPIIYASYIVDWIDSDDETIETNSAESAFYLKQIPPYRAANQPLAEIANLISVRDMTPQIINKLKPYITFLPKSSKININTVSAEVLAAAVAELNYSQALNIIEFRKNDPFKQINDFLKFFSELTSKKVPIKHLSVSSSFFIIKARAVREENLITTEALLERQSNRWPIVWWHKIR